MSEAKPENVKYFLECLKYFKEFPRGTPPNPGAVLWKVEDRRNGPCSKDRFYSLRLLEGVLMSSPGWLMFQGHIVDVTDVDSTRVFSTLEEGLAAYHSAIHRLKQEARVGAKELERAVRDKSSQLKVLKDFIANNPSKPSLLKVKVDPLLIN